MMNKPTISVEDVRSRAVEELSAFVSREYLGREPFSRLLKGLQVRGIDLPISTVKTCRGCLRVKALADFPHIDSCECFGCGLGNTPSRAEYKRRVYMRGLMRQRRTAAAV